VICCKFCRKQVYKRFCAAQIKKKAGLNYVLPTLVGKVKEVGISLVCVTCDMSRDRDDDRKAMLLLENAGSRAFVNAEIDVTLLREWNAINNNAGKGGVNSRGDDARLDAKMRKFRYPYHTHP